MELITGEQWQRLLSNGKEPDKDHIPVVKIFTPDAGATWLITECDPGDPGLLFGLCDLGIGMPELGYVRLSEIAEVRGRLNMPPERDLYTVLDQPLSHCAKLAKDQGRITT